MSNSQNTMERFRRDRDLQDRVHRTLTPMTPRRYRDALPWRMFLTYAAHQLEGKQFDPTSLIMALATFASAGLLPNKYLHHGYLIPYRDKKTKKRIVTPIFGYQGLIHLAYMSHSQNGGRLLDVSTGVIFEGDEFEDGDEDTMVRTHRKRVARSYDGGASKNPGVLLAYARFRYALNLDGMIHQYDRIQCATMDEIRAVDTGENVWATNWLRMAEKTPVRRACQSGRIELNYAAGMALQAEGMASTGDLAGYARVTQSMAREAGAEPMDFIDLEATETTNAPRPPTLQWDPQKWKQDFGDVIQRMLRPDTTRETMRRLTDQLNHEARERGAPDVWDARAHDDDVGKAWAALEEAERQG